MAEDEPDGSHQGSPLRALIGLGLIVALIVGVLVIMQQLQHAAAIQDCVASGRSNCALIPPGR
jgi:cell division septal protein FtsQ